MDENNDPITLKPNTAATYNPMDEAGFINRHPEAPAPRVGVEVDVVMHFEDIADADGNEILDGGDELFSPRWEWIRVKNGIETVIPGAGEDNRGSRASSYDVTAEDLGAQLKARMRWRDDSYNEETWTSPLYPATGVILPPATCPAPRYTGGARKVWSQELDMVIIDNDEAMPNRYGYISDVVVIDNSFDAVSTHRIDGLEWRRTQQQLIFSLVDTDLDETERNQLTLHVCGEAYPLRTATHAAADHDYTLGVH